MYIWKYNDHVLLGWNRVLNTLGSIEQCTYNNIKHFKCIHI